MTSNAKDKNKTDQGIPSRQAQHITESECIQLSDHQSPYTSETSGSIDGQSRQVTNSERAGIRGSFDRESTSLQEQATELESSNPVEQSRLLHDKEHKTEQRNSCEHFQTAIERFCNSIKVFNIARSPNGYITYCYYRKCYQKKSDYRFTCKQTFVNTGNPKPRDKSTFIKLEDSDDKRSLKDAEQELYAVPVQDTVDVNLLNITVLPVLRQITESSQQPTNDTSPFPRFEPLLTIINRMADGERVPPQTTMKYEMLRFCTLRSYPNENKPFITRLAQAGFYYANSGDEVVCYCCARRKRNWRETDKPMDVHRELNPNCRFLVNNLEVNVPIRNRDQGPSANSLLTGASVRLPNDGNLESSAENSSQDYLQSNKSSVQSSSNLPTTARNGRTLEVENLDTSVTAVREKQPLDNGRSALTVVSGGRRWNQYFSANAADYPVSRTESQSSSRIAGEARPDALSKYPKYTSRTVRLTSFGDCGDIVVTPERLAEAGFFYAGFGDCVRCFQCGVGLRHWSEDDDPWIEHSRWSKECSFVRQIRGIEFVNLVQMAVQYSQNENRSGQALSQDNLGTAGQQQTTAEADDTDPLMHSDAAQSVLEMSYHPHIIKRAIRAVLASAGRESLNAANLMEKVLEIEESGDQQTSPSETRTAYTENHAESSTSSSAVTGATGGEPSVYRRAHLLEQRRLKEENEKLKQQSVCTKCKINNVCIVFLPCGHLVTCEDCAPSVRYCMVDKCGKYIKGTVRTYMS